MGYTRDALNAALLGVGMASDAFFVAFRIPNMLRNLLAEGALSSAFIPVFTEYMQKKKKEDVWLLASNVLTVLNIVLILVTALGVIFSRPLVMIMAPGFMHDRAKFELTVQLTRYLFPFIYFVSVAALFLGILNSLKKFSMPAFAPVVLNAAMISAGLWICPLFGATPEKQVYGWVIGALSGAFLQIIIQWIPAVKEGFKYRFFIDFKEPGLRKIGKLMLPATIAQSVTQINLFVNTILASFLAGGAVTYLYYGNRLMQLPFGVFGVAIATVSFPYISQYAAGNDFENLRATIHSSLKQAFFITIPASAGLIFLSYPINALLLHYGRFTLADSADTAKVSMIYCGAVFAFTGIKILTQVFYAIDKASTAVKISSLVMGINVVLCVALMFPFNFLGLAAATAIGGVLQYWLLYHYAEKYVGDLKTGKLLYYALKITVISLIMGFAVYFLSHWMTGRFNSHYSRKVNALIVFTCMAAGAAIYAALLPIFKVSEAKTFMNMFKNRLTRGRRQPASTLGK
jgi:putative peptidoglycan lipid II flippase